MALLVLQLAQTALTLMLPPIHVQPVIVAVPIAMELARAHALLVVGANI